MAGVQVLLGGEDERALRRGAQARNRRAGRLGPARGGGQEDDRVRPRACGQGRDGIGYRRIPGSRTPGRLASVRALHQLSRHYRSGFIPWDDDIDILRSDVERLALALKGDPDFQITLVYDWFVKCRQVRFSSTNPLIPCFVDISIYDWAAENSKRSNDRLGQLRIELMEFFDKYEREFSFWKDNPWMVHPDSGFCVQSGDVDMEAQRTVISSAEIDLVQGVFDSFNKKAHDLGLLIDEPCGDFAYAIDNIFDAPKRKIIRDRSDILPVIKHPFDDFSFSVPAKAEKVAEDCYPGWPYMPMDICGHDHFAKDVLSDPDVRSAMASFVDKCNQ